MQVGHKPDFADPVVCSIDRGGTNMKAFVNQISSHLLKEFKYSMVWGVSAKHCPQRCGKEHMLLDEDVVQIVKARIKHGDEGRGRFSTVRHFLSILLPCPHTQDFLQPFTGKKRGDFLCR